MESEILSGNINWDIDAAKIVIPEKDIAMLVKDIINMKKTAEKDYPDSIKELSEIQRELFLGMLQHGVQFLSVNMNDLNKKDAFVHEIMKTQKEIHNNDLLNIMLRMWKNYEAVVISVFINVKDRRD